MTDLRYPVGKFQPEPELNDVSRQNLMRQIAEAPAKLREATKGLTEEQLDTPYRPGGWTVRQVVHHIPDSHMNAYIRFKLAVTEDEPLIRTYEEQLWAELPEAKSAEIELSLSLLDALHRRWVLFLRDLGPEMFTRKLRHPESGLQTVDRLLALYAWHGRHHVAHVLGSRSI
jgi:uncharacterized damage-inducible protein DinB